MNEAKDLKRVLSFDVNLYDKAHTQKKKKRNIEKGERERDLTCLDSINGVNEEKGQRKRGKKKEFNDTVTMEGFIKQEKKKRPQEPNRNE